MWTFYAELDELIEDISQIIPLYNKVRNYVTRKAYSLDKIRIMFEKSDFLGGWGQDFDTKKALIFEKDGLYYIGIIEKSIQIQMCSIYMRKLRKVTKQYILYIIFRK